MADWWSETKSENNKMATLKEWVKGKKLSV